MAEAELIKVAEAIRKELAGAVFSQSFQPVRSYDTDTELEDLDVLHVDVVPAGLTPEPESNTSMAYDCMVDIGIRKRFGSDAVDSDTGKLEEEEIDRLLAFEQDMIQFFPQRGLTAYTSAKFISIEVRIAWVPEHIRQYQQFTGILRVTYRSTKAL